MIPGLSTASLHMYIYPRHHCICIYGQELVNSDFEVLDFDYINFGKVMPMQQGYAYATSVRREHREVYLMSYKSSEYLWSSKFRTTK